MEAAWSKCDKSVHDAFTTATEFYTKFFAQENWKDIISKNIADNQAAIGGFTAQMVHAWNIGKYYESGKLAGLITQIEFGYEPEPTAFPF